MPAIVFEACITNHASKSHDKSAVRLSGLSGLGHIGKRSNAMLVHLRTMTISCACQVRLLLHRGMISTLQETHHAHTNTMHH